MLFKQYKTQNNINISCPICKYFENRKEYVSVYNGMGADSEQSINILICVDCSFRLTFDSDILVNE